MIEGPKVMSAKILKATSWKVYMVHRWYFRGQWVSKTTVNFEEKLRHNTSIPCRPPVAFLDTPSHFVADLVLQSSLVVQSSLPFVSIGNSICKLGRSQNMLCLGTAVCYKVLAEMCQPRRQPLPPRVREDSIRPFKLPQFCSGRVRPSATSTTMGCV